MALNFKHPVQRVLSATADVQYAPSGVSFQIDSLKFTNTSGVDVTVSVWTTSGGGPSDSTLTLIDYPVPARATKKPFEVSADVIEDGMQLYASASVAGVVTLAVSGRTKTV